MLILYHLFVCFNTLNLCLILATVVLYTSLILFILFMISCYYTSSNFIFSYRAFTSLHLFYSLPVVASRRNRDHVDYVNYVFKPHTSHIISLTFNLILLLIAHRTHI
jgi:hypothetical protein